MVNPRRARADRRTAALNSALAIHGGTFYSAAKGLLVATGGRGMAVNVRRIDCAADNALEQIDAIRRQLSPDGEVVPESGRALTQQVFGEALSPVPAP